MAINIPNRPTLMDHLANVGARFVENKALTDRQRMEQEFLLNRDEKNQSYMTKIAEMQNDTQLKAIDAQGKVAYGLEQLRGDNQFDIAELTTNAQKSMLATEEYGKNTRFKLGEEGATKRLVAELNNRLGLKDLDLQAQKAVLASEEYRANLSALTQTEIERMRQDGNYALQELMGKQQLTLEEKQQGARLVELMNTLDAQLQMSADTNATQRGIASDANATNRYGIDKNYDANMAGLSSAERLAKMGYTSAEDMQDKDILFRERTMGAALLAQKEREESAQKFQIEMQDRAQKFQAGESDKLYDFQAMMNEPTMALQKQELKQAEYVFNEAVKNPGGAVMKQLAPILKANGLSVDEFLNPQKDGRIWASMKALLGGHVLSSISNLVIGTNYGYENELDKVKNVETAMGRMSNARLYTNDPLTHAANNIMNVTD